jgi:glycosyltransferase involved in cell wall biosynthesis
LVYPNGKLQEAGGIIWQDATGWNYGRMQDPSAPEYNYVKEVDYVSGACVMVRRHLWEKLGGFDERFAPAYYEDTDLAFEIRKQGFKVIYQPKSVVVHFEGVSHGTDENSGLKAYQVANREKFLNKWKSVLESDHQKNATKLFSARDRSNRKKTIVVIDHYVPHFDKDAGSRMTFQYLSLLLEMGFNVKFIGDNFFKHEPYTDTLQQLGIEVLYGEYYMKHWKNWVIENAECIDAFYLHRPHVAEKYIDTIKKHTNAKIAYFTHDLHHLRLQRRYEIEKDKKILEQAEMWRVKEMSIFEKVDCIHTPSTAEKEMIMAYFPQKNVMDVPLYLYENFMPAIPDFQNRKDLLFVGGFNHHPNRDGLIWFIKNIFPIIKNKLPDIKLNVIGSNPTDEIKKLASDSILVHGFVSDEKLKEFYSTSKLVIVPLRFGAGVKGKLLEAMYHGVPVVSTAIGLEGIRNIENILKPNDAEQDFADRVISLYQNDSELKELSEKCVEFIKNYASKQTARSLMQYSLGMDDEKNGHESHTIEQLKETLKSTSQSVV